MLFFGWKSSIAAALITVALGAGHFWSAPTLPVINYGASHLPQTAVIHQRPGIFPLPNGAVPVIVQGGSHVVPGRAIPVPTPAPLPVNSFPPASLFIENVNTNTNTIPSPTAEAAVDLSPLEDQINALNTSVADLTRANQDEVSLTNALKDLINSNSDRLAALEAQANQPGPNEFIVFPPQESGGGNIIEFTPQSAPLSPAQHSGGNMIELTPQSAPLGPAQNSAEPYVTGTPTTYAASPAFDHIRSPTARTPISAPAAAASVNAQAGRAPVAGPSASPTVNAPAPGAAPYAGATVHAPHAEDVANRWVVRRNDGAVGALAPAAADASQVTFLEQQALIELNSKQHQNCGKIDKANPYIDTDRLVQVGKSHTPQSNNVLRDKLHHLKRVATTNQQKGNGFLKYN